MKLLKTTLTINPDFVWSLVRMKGAESGGINNGSQYRPRGHHHCSPRQFPALIPIIAQTLQAELVLMDDATPRRGWRPKRSIVAFAKSWRTTAAA